MNIVNIMNFVRSKTHGDYEMMLKTTKSEIELVKKYGFDNTFLLQYDAVIDPNYIKLFKENIDEKMELGLWFEVVRPLVLKVGLEWRGKDADWDWHIIPGFLMAYTQEERRMLVDEAMRMFKETFGFYPKSVGSWLIDSYSIEYMSEKYDIKAFAVCRDQISTDAYTLIGGILNNGYFPSKYNMLCPAQTKENMIKTPVFKLLGACPIYNYDPKKLSDKEPYLCTMELAQPMGKVPENVDWFFKTTLENENLGNSYIQLGQENSFWRSNVAEVLDMQLQILTNKENYKILKLCDAGELFAKEYKETPQSAVVALDDWKGNDIQCVHYNSKNYTANLVNFCGKLNIRGLFKFDESFKELYYDKPCETWDATYENLPIIDSQAWGKSTDDCGIYIDGLAEHFKAINENGDLAIVTGDKKIIFSQEKIVLKNCSLNIVLGNCVPRITLIENEIKYKYKDFKYSIKIDGSICKEKNGFVISPIDNEIIIDVVY